MKTNNDQNNIHSNGHNQWFNRNRKKAAIMVVICALFIVLAVALVTALIRGRELKVSPDRTLSGVDKDVCDALWYASVSANSHNTQALKVKLYPDAGIMEVRVDDSRTLKVVDPAKREAYFSVGCYLETLRESFEAYGFDTDISFFKDKDGCKADVIYRKKTETAFDAGKLSLINKRHTDKSAFSTDALDKTAVDKILKSYKQTEDAADTISVTWFQTGSDGYRYLQDGTLDAIKAQSENQDYRDELADWMRFSDREAAEKLDGISGDMIGLKGMIKSIYYWTTSHESAKEDKFAEQGISTAKKQLDGCGAFFVITGENTQEELMQAGMTTQSLWFDCTENGISIQPMSAMLEISPYADNIQKDLSMKQQVQMILRAGYAKNYGKNIGLRRNLTDYIEVVR